MMSSFVLIGLTALLLSPSGALAQGGVYDYVLQTVQWEQAHQDAEVAVEEFAPRVITSSVISFEPEDVDSILLGNLTSSCEPSTERAVDEGTCTKHKTDVTLLTKREAKIRGFIREMQMIASGHESIVRNKPESIARKLPSIIRIWQSDADLLATRPGEGNTEPGELDEQIEDVLVRIEDALRALMRSVPRRGSTPEIDLEHFIAAVHRYRHGVPAGEPCDQDNTGKGDGTELQFLEARWCAIEDLLRDLGATASIGLGLDSETRVVLREIDNLDIDIWVQGTQAGFAWKKNLLPVLPSLNCSTITHSYGQPEDTCKKLDDVTPDGAILGGLYPGELEDVLYPHGICGDPLHENGYLCNGPLSGRCPDPDDEEEGEEDTVLLARCTQAALKGVNRWTVAGPDICLEGGWRLESHPPDGFDTHAIDDDPDDAEDFLPHRCSNCRVDLYCSDTCAAGGLSQAKSANGVIPTCIGTELGALTEGIILHELVHAQQKCNSPPGQTMYSELSRPGSPGCCATEYQAYLLECKMFAQDGILVGAGYNVETCAAAFTNFSCGGDGSCSDLSPGLTSQDVLDDIEEYANDNAEELGLSTDCEEAVNNLDERSQMIKNSLPQVCTPECQSLHGNTIGNLLCALGQCIEQSMEGHRLTPGRMPLAVSGQAYPWDSAIEMIKSEEAEDDAFELTANPDTITVPLPPYRPRYLIGKLDDFFCRTNALPKRTPPVLCEYNSQSQGAAGRQTPGGTLLKFFIGFLEQSSVTTSLTDTMRRAAPGIGARVGSRLHSSYLSTALRPLDELVKSANLLLKKLAETEFPTEMCPYDSTRP